MIDSIRTIAPKTHEIILMLKLSRHDLPNYATRRRIITVEADSIIDAERIAARLMEPMYSALQQAWDSEIDGILEAAK